jgi:cation/acetate symporter
VIHSPTFTAVFIFGLFVAFTLGLSFYFARKTKSASSYFAAGGQIHWFVNGVAFAGDYLSAASFLGICGMIAFYGYDGFLYSIGYLAGWIVALFVVAEPLKRLGKFTFADALAAKFQSPGIKLAAGISTLVVSLFYLIPQMVGAGALVKPLLGFSHATGVCLVGAVVMLIVVTAGMVSTTYVQFLKGSLLVVFSTILTFAILNRGFSLPASDDPLAKLDRQTMTITKDGQKLVNGKPWGQGEGQGDFFPVGSVVKLPGNVQATGPLGPLQFFRTLEESTVLLWSEDKTKITGSDGSVTTVYNGKPVSGADVLMPGNSPTFAGLRSHEFAKKLNFLSLMLALFCGTASLPHILIRYYTVKDQAAARKSTVVGIASIGFFYVLTLYIGLGAMTGGTLDVTNSNMAAPLLARGFGELLFACISAIAFTTVLGTVAGLIVAAAGAIVHDLLTGFFKMELNDHEKVRVGRVGALGVGIVAILLGIVFEKMNVTFLVGWAFSVAASANMPSLAMLLFWKGTTREGIIVGILVGMLSSLAWVLMSADAFKDVYGLPPDQSPLPFSQPGIVTIPLGFAAVIVTSLLTRRKEAATP